MHMAYLFCRHAHGANPHCGAMHLYICITAHGLALALALTLTLILTLIPTCILTSIDGTMQVAETAGTAS